MEGHLTNIPPGKRLIKIYISLFLFLKSPLPNCKEALKSIERVCTIFHCRMRDLHRNNLKKVCLTLTP